MEKLLSTSVVLISVGVIALVASVSAIRYHQNKALNKDCLSLSLFLLIWCAGQALSNASADEQTALLFIRVSYFGLFFLLGALAHYMFVFTGHTQKHFFSYPLIFAPAVALSVLYCLPPAGGSLLFELSLTGHGWAVTGLALGFPGILLITYLALSILLSIAMLLRWMRLHPQRGYRQQALLLSGSLLASALLVLVHQFLVLFGKIMLPPIFPAYAIITIIAIFVGVRKYEMLIPQATFREETILSRSTQTKTLQYISFVLYFCSAANLVILRINHFGWMVSIITTGLIVAAGMIARRLDRLEMEADKEVLLSVVLSIVIPLMIIEYVQTGAVTVWAVPLMMIVVCTLFNKFTVLLAVGVSAFLSCLLVWMRMPVATEDLNASDHIVRLILYVVCGAFSFYVNRVYLGRIEENIRHLNLQKLIAEISHEFISVSPDTFEEKIAVLLERCGKFFRVERAYIVLFNETMDGAAYHCEWTQQGVPSYISAVLEQAGSVLPGVARMLEQRDMIEIDDLELASPLLRPAVELAAGLSVRSLAYIAVKSQGKPIGYMGINSSHPQKEWRANYIEFLSVIANTVADAVVKVRTERTMNHIAYHDQLTKLPNRLYFDGVINDQIKRAKALDNTFAVVFIDLDSFKSINDTMGHDLGDMLLYEVASALKDCLLPGDLVSRFGGDEFVIMLSDVANGTLPKRMERIMGIFEKPFLLKGQEFYVTTSAGVSLYPEDGPDAVTLIKNADTAMYYAKSSGKKKYTLCSDGMKREVLEKVRLTNLLYPALEKRQMELHYQPQICLFTGQIVGLEALCRWRLPEGRMVPPNAFIPLAEQTGLINSIGQWVLHEACAQNKRWQEMGFKDLRIAVNVSLVQLRNPALTRQVREVLEETGMPPQTLDIEITESNACAHNDDLIRVFDSLKQLGVCISIDDFGTEYSSLNRLKMLPIDRIKMDMQFVRGIEKSDKDKAIAKIIINLAKSLNLKVLAEGVETKTQLDFLNQKMCDEVQGFYYYKPMPAKDIEEILLRKQSSRGVG
ncbi:MAG: EAL domain-containing protein [Bacillota bacterium]